MLLYELAVRDQLEHTRAIAARLWEKFEAETPADELLSDAELLQVTYEQLRRMVPASIKDNNFARHLAFTLRYLRQDEARNCKIDVMEINKYDLPAFERSFREWCASKEHYDPELAAKVTGLLTERQFDSAIRKAFVILKARLVATFGAPADLDGRDLVNAIFGSKGLTVGNIADGEREGMRSLLDGLYGLLRNPYGHNDLDAEWYELEAALSMVNWALRRLDTYVSARAAVATR